MSPGVATGAPQPTLAVRLLADGVAVAAAPDGTWTAPGIEQSALRLEVVAANGVGSGATAVATAMIDRSYALPAAFAAEDWALLDWPSQGADRLAVDIRSLPHDGGAVILAIEARIGDTAPFRLEGMAAGLREIIVPAGVQSAVRLRAVNPAGPGPWSAEQAATPSGIIRPPAFSDATLSAPLCAGGEIMDDIGTWGLSGGVRTPLSPDASARLRGFAPWRLSGTAAWHAVIARVAYGARRGSRWRLSVIARQPETLASPRVRLQVRALSSGGESVSVDFPFTGALIGAVSAYGEIVDPARVDLGDGWRRFEATLVISAALAADPDLRLWIGPGSSTGESIILAAAYAAPLPSLDAAAYAVRDPIAIPFAADSFYNTPLAQTADIRPTAAFTHFIGAPGAPLGNATVERVMAAPEENHIVVALGPVAAPASTAGASEADLAAAAAGHPDSPNVGVYTLRNGGANIEGGWPTRAPGMPTALLVDSRINPRAAFTGRVEVKAGVLALPAKERGYQIGTHDAAGAPRADTPQGAGFLTAVSVEHEEPRGAGTWVATAAAHYNVNMRMGTISPKSGSVFSLSNPRTIRITYSGAALSEGVFGTQSFPADHSYSGLRLPRDWIKTNRFGFETPPELAAELSATYASGAQSATLTPADLLYQQSGNGCTAIILEHPVSGETAVWQMSGVERPVANGPVWSTGTAPNESTWASISGVVFTQPAPAAAMPFNHPRQGFMSIALGRASSELFRGASTLAVDPLPAAMPRVRRDYQSPVVSAATFGTPLLDPSTIGNHAGSRTSILGGTVSLDALCAPGDAIDTIRHVIGLNPWGGFLSRRDSVATWTGANGAVIDMTPGVTPALTAPDYQSGPTSNADPATLTAAQMRQRNNQSIRAVGRVWPASSLDAYGVLNAPGTTGHVGYVGVDPNVAMGSLLVLPSQAWVDANPTLAAARGITAFDPMTELATIPARRIAWALMHFGGVPNDSEPAFRVPELHSFKVCVEDSHKPARAGKAKWRFVQTAMWERFGIRYKTGPRDEWNGVAVTPGAGSWKAPPSPADADYAGWHGLTGAPGDASEAWRRDMCVIMRRLCVVVNNMPETPGGGQVTLERVANGQRMTGRVLNHVVAPTSLLGGFFTLGGVVQPFAALTLYRDAGGVLTPQTVDAFGAAHVNRAIGGDLTAGAAIWGDLDRGWYRVGAGAAYSPPIFVEIGGKRLGTWGLAP